MTNLVICILVRDELPTLPGMLAELPPWASVCVADTGSVDGTREWLQQWASFSIPGRVRRLVEFPWDWSTGFAGAWNRAWSECDDMVPRGGWRLSLGCDSFVHDDDGSLERLAADPDAFGRVSDQVLGFWTESRMQGSSWRRPLLTRVGHGWTWKYRVHEIPTHPSGDLRTVIQGNLPGLWIEHRRDANTNRSRWGEYLEAMREDRREMPDDTRVCFYFAQTLEGACRPLEAVAQYEARIEMGGWDQERYIAALRVARIHHVIAGPERGLALANRAVSICPNRPEAHELAAQCARELSGEQWLFREGAFSLEPPWGH
jgi:hypothetical protein